MAKARTSVGELREIIETSLEDGVLQSNMIDTANLFVDAHLTTVGHSNNMLAKIEMYLAAHFTAISEESGSVKFTKLGDASEAYDTTLFGDGLGSTRYGQTALMLDTSGTLANITGTGKRAEFRVI